jgi:hypothetical protein
MKFKIALIAVFVAGLTTSLAVAAPPNKPHKNTSTTTATATTTQAKGKKPFCRARASLIMRGTLASVAEDQLSFTMVVTKTNRQARLLRGQTVTVQVGPKTKIWRLGQKVALSALTLGDRVNVQARVCKRSTDATAAPLAVRIVARPAEAASPPTTTTTS